MHIGDRIKARRMEMGLSQRDLAARMGYKNHSAVARVEAGTVDLSQSRVAQFAQVLGVTPAYLMGWVDAATSEKNSQLAKLTVRMKNDIDFFELVLSIAELDEKQYRGVKQLVAALSEQS